MSRPQGRPPVSEGEQTVPIVVRLPESQAARAREVAASRGVSLAALVRRALRQHLARAKP